MSLSALAPDAVLPLHGTTAAAFAFRSRGQLYVTIIAKATFAFAPDASMSRTDAQEIFRAEVHHGHNPARSVRFTSDLAPYLGRTDVLFTGYAHAPSGETARAQTVRLALFAGDRPLVDKRLLVRDPGGFERMPMVYERASGGVDGKDNPLGLVATSDEPNIVDPERPERPAGFGPIARAWPARKRRLGATPRQNLEGPIAEIPEGFDWSYFQAAPPDQWTEHLAGDEWIVLEGLHPTLTRLQTRLPGARGRARVFGLSAFGVREGQPLDLALDTLRIDGEEQRCTLVFRQSFPVNAGEPALASLRVVAGVELPGEALAWPEALAPASGDVTSAPSAPTPRLSPETFALSPEDEKVAAERPNLPFPAAPPKHPPPPPALAFAPEPIPDLPPRVAAPLVAPAQVSALYAAPPMVSPPSALDASNAAAATPRAAEAPAAIAAIEAPVEKPPRTSGLFDLLWFDPRCLARVRKQPAWRPILDALGDEPLDPDIDDPALDIEPAAAEERREIFEVVAHGEALSADALRGALDGAIRSDGRFIAPLALLAGEIAFPFDELETLKAMVSTITPLTGGDARLKETLATAGEFLKTADLLSSSTAAAGLCAGIQDAYARGKHTAPMAQIDAQVERALLENRRYQRRAVFGGAHLRCLFQPEGAAPMIPTYLPDALAEALPMFQRFGARLVAELHLAADQHESHPLALRVVALARAQATAPRW